MGLILLAFVIGKLVKSFPLISGSGIPQLKGVLENKLSHNWLYTFLTKFLGGALSILGGLSLGREGPSIQLGACIAEGISKHTKTKEEENKILIASGAGAGLSAAFNAPLSGVIFCIEELLKSASPLIVFSVLFSSLVADRISKMFFGKGPIFSFETGDYLPFKAYIILLMLGAFLGFFGAFYNWFLLKLRSLFKKIPNSPHRIMLPLFLALILGIYFPYVLCGGHKIIEILKPQTSLCFLLITLVLKFLFSCISFASGAPGGIFFPVLIIGATVGAIFGQIGCFFGLDGMFYNFVVLAMAGYLTAIVRAPFTSVFLLVEMTGNISHILPLGVVALVAYLVSNMIKSKPIYDSLLKDILNEKKQC